jgi:hypothetical protein
MLWQIHGTPKDVNVRFSASGDNTLIAAPSGTNMFIHSLVLNPASAVTVKIKLGARQVGGDIDLAANQAFSTSDLPGMDGQGYYECKTGEAFIVNLSSAVSVTGAVKYSYIDTTL